MKFERKNKTNNPRRNNMKKTILILTLALTASYTALADAVTYDSAKEIIERIQFETRHK